MTTQTAQAITATPYRQTSLAIWALVVSLAVACALSLVIGARGVGLADVIAALAGRDETIAQAAVATRIPRTILAALAGAALAASGAMMQGVTRNPLADPGILGINTGAALAVVIGIAAFGMTATGAFIWVAILGAAIAAIFVYAIGAMGPSGATPLKLTLAGASTTIAAQSLTLAIILPRNDIAGNVRAWQIGGVGGATSQAILQVLPLLILGLAIGMAAARKLNLLALGDAMAAGLGERVAVARIVTGLGAVILCGATTAVCGPIGFVGLIVPHLCRMLVGSDYRRLLPVSALAGALLLILADTLGRVLAGQSELDVGIVTALIGAPFFIWTVRRQRMRAL